MITRIPRLQSGEYVNSIWNTKRLGSSSDTDGVYIQQLNKDKDLFKGNSDIPQLAIS